MLRFASGEEMYIQGCLGSLVHFIVKNKTTLERSYPFSYVVPTLYIEGDPTQHQLTWLHSITFILNYCTCQCCICM